ncbi:MAG: peptidoglycan DD-metalloendopeptidase family protein [Burkholderiales bacterium]
MKKRFIGLLLCWVAAFAAHAMPAHAPVPGGVARVRIDGDESALPLVPPTVRFQGRRVLVVRDERGWLAVVGLSLDTKPGIASLAIEAPAGARSQAFEVVAKNYPEQRLTIADKRKVDPSADDMKRINREQETINRIRAHWEPIDPVDLDLMLPAEAPLSSRFGLRRVFNGQARSPHNGLDLAVPRGTPIHAAAAGVVTHTEDLFFAGNTVFVDHGQGFITMYCHLDEIAVRIGERVARGQRLGRSGMTGRVTGPHLHWSTFLNGTAVDPELFLRR